MSLIPKSYTNCHVPTSRAQPRLHVQERVVLQIASKSPVRDALADGSAGTGSSLQPHTENNETSETLDGSIIKKHIFTDPAPQKTVTT